MGHPTMRIWAGLLGAAFLLAELPGCEEVLEVCQPCGSFLDGDITISGDPRIDGTFDAVNRARDLAAEADRAFVDDLTALGEAFDTPADATPAELAAAVRNQLLDHPNLRATLGSEPSACWIDAESAADAEARCEQRLECNLSDLCFQADAPVSCLGYYEGSCSGGAADGCDADAGPCAGERCEGRCFGEAGSASCTDRCIGLCAEIDGLVCPGLCLGLCTGGCSAYGATGDCAGYCDGLCTGSCEAGSAFGCNGRCLGRCELPLDASGECPGLCEGRCLDPDGNPMAEGNGRCRGHVVPAGCDDKCADCREMAKLLAWSEISCDPARQGIGLSFADGYSGDRDAPVAKARALERVLDRAFYYHARLALLVDGVDETGLLDAGALAQRAPGEDEALAYLADPEYARSVRVAAGSEHLPLFGLKARVGMLSETASSGDFMIAAGALPCVGPALADAMAVLDQMLPVEETDGGFAQARACPAPDGGVLAPCLYRIVDGYGLLVDLAR